MKKTFSRLLAVMLLVSTICVTGASAADSSTPSVHVNDLLVNFPDKQPFIDSNNRTLIPVRFVTEALGASVSWSDNTNTATITLDGTTVKVQIGNKVLTVLKNGSTSTVTMDTQAVISSDRTCVPIRFVAESLGAYVDFSDTRNVVGIYMDKLTSAQITKLRSYGYTQSKGAVSYASAQSTFTAEQMAYNYGIDRSSFAGAYGYSNSREHLYNISGLWGNTTKILKTLNKTIKGETNEEFYSYVVKEAVADIAYDSSNVTFSFIGDSSGLYQEDNMDRVTTTVRGIIVMTCKVNPTSLNGTEMTARVNFGLTGSTKVGVTYYVPVDIHMNTAGSTVYMKTIVPLDSQYAA